MKIVIPAVVIFVIALVLLFSFNTGMAGLFDLTGEPGDEPSSAVVSLESVPFIKIIQGESAVALFVLNNTAELVKFSVGHEHEHLTLMPRNDQLIPSGITEISLHVNPECPAGEITLPVYLRADLNGERFGLETVVTFEVIPGKLTLEQADHAVNVLWNNGPAPRGVTVFYRVPGELKWQNWGVTPRIDDPPDHLAPGDHSFEFKALLGEVQSPVELLSITVEEIITEAEPQKIVYKEKPPPAQHVVKEGPNLRYEAYVVIGE